MHISKSKTDNAHSHLQILSLPRLQLRECLVMKSWLAWNYVIQTDLELTAILLPQPPECWDYRCALYSYLCQLLKLYFPNWKTFPESLARPSASSFTDSCLISIATLPGFVPGNL